jgi:hypothetical protein
MTIALSARVRPSRLWIVLQIAMAAVLLSVACWLFQASAAGGPTDALCYLFVLVCATASFVLVIRALRPRTGLRIDVTRLGQIRLVETYPNAEAGLPRLSDAEGKVVQLRQGSTLWSSLMVLRLQPVTGNTITLILLPDSMRDDAFHALSVACRWIAARQNHHDALSVDLPPWLS